MKARRWFLFSSILLASLLLLPSRVWACACCANEGEYRIGFSRLSASELGLMKRMRFGNTARLFATAAGLDQDAKGLSHQTETYSLTGTLVGNLWKLAFRDANDSGTLNLPLPAKMLSYRADVHDGKTNGGGGPLLYKEWRFEGQVNGTGFFQAGIVAPTKYFLVFQGRGNNCDNAEDFTHWRLEIRGQKAGYALYGELAKPKFTGRVKV